MILLKHFMFKVIKSVIGAVLLATTTAQAATDTFVPFGSVWRFLDDGSDQGTAWVAPAFEDSLWNSGPAELGYGDNDEVTVVSFGGVNNNKHLTTYFRHSFNVPNPSIYTVLRIGVFRDDGIVVYLNGNEVFRNNMGNGSVFFDTFAQNANDDGNALIEGTINPSNLLPGNNVLAVEIHQDSRSSSDISFDLNLVGSTDNDAPTVALVSPSNNASFTAPANVQLRASASDPDGNLASVEFFQSSTSLGIVTSAPFTVQWSGVPVGIYALYAVATDALNLRTTSSVAQITVAPSTPPTIVRKTPAPGNVAILTQLTVAFSEPVSGVKAGDLLINGRAAATVSGAGTNYTFTFPQPADGVVFVAWNPRHGIVDFENPPRNFDAFAAGANWQYSLADALAPTAVIHPTPGASVRSLTSVTIQFNEPVAGVDASDLLVNNVAAASVTGNGSGPYEFAFAQPANGAVTLAWAAGANIRDLSGARNLLAGGSWSYTLNTNAVFEDRVVINEIMYHPVTERDDHEWIELHNRGSNSVNLTGWQLSRGADYAFGNVSIPAGGYLVVAANVTAFNQANPGVANVVGGWDGRLSNSGEDIELEDASGARVDIVNYNEQGEFGVRQRWTVDSRGWEWFAEHDGLGKSLELRNASLDNDQGQNWAASVPSGGTPGTANSVASTDIAPMVLDVAHFPIVPGSTNAITVTARIVDEQTSGLTIRLRWRDASTTTPDVFISAVMFDDGAHGDALANDRVYGAAIPAHGDKTVLEYYVEATDPAGGVRTWPAAAREVGGEFQQTANALIQVDNEAYPGSQPVYRVIMTESDRVAFAAQTRNSDAQRNVTFVATEGSRTEVRHNCGLRYRGAGSRGQNPPTMRLNIVGDRKWNNKSAINLNSQFTHAQVIGGQVSLLAGLPSEYARAVQLRVNGSNPANAGLRQFGSYAAVEATNGELVGEHLPDDGDGNVYRASTGNHSATLNYLGTDPSSYIGAGYVKNSNATDNDWTDLINLTFALDPATTSDAEYVTAVRRNVNVEMWLRYFAMCSLMEYTETSLASGRGDDYGLYRGITDPRFIILPHDFDTIFGQGDTGGNVNESIYVATAVGTIDRFLRHPEFEPLYHAEFRRLLATTFATNHIFGLVDQFLGEWVPAQNITAMKTFIAARNAAVLAQLPPEPVLVRASVSGEPPAVTYLNTATLTIGGADITHYRYRLNGGAFGAETPVGTPISLNGLADGTYTVFVIGRDSSGVWQEESAATLSQTWTVLSGLRGVVISEVLARNVSAVSTNGAFPDLIELHNPRATSVDLSGLRLTDDLNAPNRFVFPAGTSIPAGGYLVLRAAVSDGSPGLHLGFGLDQNGESIYLLDTAANGSGVLDSVRFGFQLADRSIGRLGNGEWALCLPTFGAANTATATGNPSSVKINEWLASGASPFLDDFIELYNPDPLPVAIGGLFLTDLPVGLPFRHEITPLSFLPGFSYKAFIADNAPELGADHVGFQLASSIGEIGLMRPDASAINAVVYGVQRAGISQGRAPNGGDKIVSLSPPTPGAPNPVPPAPPEPVLVNLLPLSDTFLWRFEQSGNDLGTEWTAPNYNDASWPEGVALFAREDNGVTPELIRTPLTVAGGKITFYFRTHFNVPAGLVISSLQATHAIDDGAVFHINGVEAGRFNMPGGTIGFGTQASGSHEATSLETISLSLASLVPGDNVLAVEVHQQGFNSSDIVFGMKLDAVILTNPPSAAGIVINEVLANNQSFTNLDGSVSDWVELRNPSNASVDLAGMSLTDQLEDTRRWVFPAGSVIAANGYLLVRFDPNVPATTNASSSLNAGFGLSASGDAVFFFNRPDAGGELLDAVTFGLQAENLSIARVPAGGTNWSLALPTPGAANLAAALGNPSSLRINEWMADPGTGADWFEVYNGGAQPVSLAGISVTDDLNDRTKNVLPALSFIGAGAEAFREFKADNDPAAGADHVNFRLSANGESLGIIAADGTVIDSVSFGAQFEGVSEGRLPDGSASIVQFIETSTPGRSNYRLMDGIVINEVLTHSELPLEDAIELRNIGGVSVDISGWYLSDSLGNPLKFVIPENTVLAPGQHVVFYENEFNLLNPVAPFSLSSANGDEVYLSAASGPGVLTGYRAEARFGAAEKGISFGRHVTSIGPDFTALSVRTFGEDSPSNVEEFRTGTGATNAYPLVGPIVISEVMYHPPPLTPGGTNENEAVEFVELHNISATAVSLFDAAFPTNTWRLRDAVDFEFPGRTSLAAGARALVVGFDPVTNAAALAAFRTTYALSPAIPIYGPWRGRLANNGDNIELYKPDAPIAVGLPDAGFVPYVQVDKVRYSDAAPWPALADGSTNGAGVSLQRRVVSDYGNDPVNWLAGVPTPGAVTGPASATLPVITSLTPPLALAPGANASLTVAATGSAPLSYQWRFNGQLIAGAVSATLPITNFQPTNAGAYSVLVANSAGAASAVTTIEQRSAPVILRQPENQAATTNSTVVFSVLSAGTEPLAYQWRKGGANIPGATNLSLTIANVQLGDAAGYRVVITNLYGSVTSSVAVLSVVSPPVIVSQPAGTNLLVGQTANFSVSAIGSEPLFYQWRYEGLNIPGATNATFTLVNVQLFHAGTFTVRVTNIIGAAISEPAVLGVALPPSVTVVATDAVASEPGADSGLFTLSRTGSTDAAVTVSLAISGPAVPGTDYAALPISMTIPAGSSSVTIPVTVLDDTTLEGNEGVTMTVLSGIGYAIGSPASATVVILDNDNQAPVVTITEPANGFIANFPAVITIAATATDSDGSVARVEFFANGTDKIGESVTAPFAFSWTNAAAGSYQITAVATDNLGATGVSAPVALLVNALPIVRITAPLDGSFLSPGDNINVTATASDSDGSVTLVEFYAGSTFLGSDSSSPYSVAWTDIAEGVYSLRAQATDNRGAVQASTPVTITVGRPPITFGDMFSARGLTSGFTNIVRGTNITFTREAGEPRHASRNGNHSGWISWTAPASGLLRLDTIGSSFDTLLAIYTGSSVSNLTVLAANDDINGDSVVSAVSLNVTNGLTYHIAVDGLGTNGTVIGANAGTIVLNMALPNPYPVFLTQPQSLVVTQGATATFTATTAGPGPQTYNWRLNGTTIPGATNLTYTRANVQATNAGNYTVVASNSSGSTTSAVAVLVISGPPTITTQPSDNFVPRDSTGVFVVEVVGVGPFAYQWRFNGADIPGATLNTLTLENVQGRQEGAYSVRVTNPGGSVTSRDASLIVDDGLVSNTFNVLLDFTNTWRFEASGQNLSNAWRFADFDDSSWASGAALFGYESTPDIYSFPFSTPFTANSPGGTAIQTYYLRTHFHVEDLASVGSLTIYAFVDDGAVWYLNGREAVRIRIPGNAPVDGVGYAVRANNQNNEGSPDILDLPVTNLVAGENLLSVELHQGNLPSSDVVFGMLLGSFKAATNGPVVSVQGAAEGDPVQVTVTGISGRNYALDISTNLVNWVPAVTWTNFTGTADYLDPVSPAAGNRFYRGRLVR